MEKLQAALSINQLDNNLNLDIEVARYRGRAMVAIQTAFMVGAGVLLSLYEGDFNVKFAILTSMLFSASSIYFALKGKIGASAVILAAQFLILPTYLAFSGLGTFDSVIIVFPAGMMAMSVVGKPRTMAIFSLMTISCVTFIAIATLKNWIGNTAFASVVATNHIDIITTFVVVCFSGIVSIYMSVVLTGLLRTLADHQATLENKIDHRTRDLEASNDELRLAINDLDKARVELVRGEKLAGLGSLVAGVSHELNTPIGNTAVAASTLLDIVREFKHQTETGKLRKSDLARFLNQCTEGTELIMSSTHRARDLVSSFKQVAVDQTSDRRRVFKLDEVIGDVVRTMRPGFKGHEWVIDCSLTPDIVCDSYPGPLGQVMSNLIQNSVLHGFGDRLHGCIRISAQLLDGEQVQVIVSDDGKGIAEESIAKIFDPFFTTRLGQGGSGLGLTIVHNLVTAMLCGRIEVVSTLGKGTQFTLTFPLVAPQTQGFK